MTGIVENNKETIAELCADHHVRRLSLFGSATKDGFDEAASDLDFLVEFDELMPAQHADAYFGLLENLKEVFHRPVDLVERRAIKNPYFLKEIDQNRVEVYAAA